MKKITLILFVLLGLTASSKAEEKTVWEGSEAISWNTEVAPGTQYETPTGTFTGLEAGQVVRIYTTTTYDDPQYVVTYKKGDGWAWTDIETTLSEGILSFTVADDTQATEIAERGLILRGQAWTATKITVETEDEKPETSFIISTTEWTAGNWAGNGQVSIGDLTASTTLEEGDVIRIYVRDFVYNEGTPSISLSYTTGDSWSWADFQTSYQYYNPASTTAYVDFRLTGELLNVLNDAATKSLLIRGSYYTGTKVELIKSSGYYVSLSDQYTALYLPGTANVNITRSLLAGYNTITVPFAATAEELTGSGEAKLYELTGVNTEGDVVLTFTKVDATEANKPYLIYVASDVDVQDQSAITISELVDDWQNQKWAGSFCMQGNYKPSLSVYQVNGKACYVVSDEYAIAPTGSAATLNGMRAYIYDNASSCSEVKSNITFAIDDTETGVEVLTLGGSPVGKRMVYSLSGQRMNQLQRGVNIVDGKKIVIK